LKSLQQLSLFGNHLSSSFQLFPAAIGGLRNFTHLRLYKNQLSGSLPEELGNLESFVNLEVGNNQLSGPVPASIGNLTNLEV
jgi:Leucine-rich repeat (LRR) protein